MKKVLGVVIVLVLLVLDAAALHDIFTGIEPNLIGEYVTLAVSAPVLVLVGRVLL